MARNFLAILIAFVAANVSTSYGNQFETITLTGDRVPGASDDTVFDVFWTPSINNQGNVAFRADVEDASQTGTGIWLGNATDLNPVVQSGDSLPGTAAGTELDSLSGLGPYPLNDAGQVFFAAGVESTQVPSVSQFGLWTATTSGLKKIALSGEVFQSKGEELRVSGFQDSTFVLNAQGDVAFSSFMTRVADGSRANGALIARNNSPGLELLAANGSSVGPAAPGFQFTIGGRLPNLRLRLNDAGSVAFGANILDGQQRFEAIFISDPNSLEIPLRSNDPATAAGSGFFFTSRVLPAGFNNQGKTLIAPGLNDGTNSLDSIWKVDEDSRQLIVLEGERFSAEDPNLVIGDLFYEPVMNAQGKFSVFGSVQLSSGANRRGAVLAGSANNIEIIAIQGGEAPGTGGVFGRLIRNTPVMNDLGQIAFTGQIQGETPIFGSLWATDIQGDLQLIAKPGDLLEVRPGDVREIAGIRFADQLRNGSGGEDGRARGLNDLGQITFQATFSDGSQGVFISNLVAVPEPGLGMFVLSLAVCTIGRQLRRA